MREVKLSKGYVAFVDEEDFEAVNLYKWSVIEGKLRNDGTRRVYARRARSTKESGGIAVTQLMHRFLLPTKGGEQVDHIDGNTLNNTRANLRVCSNTENMQNRRPSPSRTTCKGVRKVWNSWQAEITVNGVVHRLGAFPSELAAAEAYNKAALKYFGKFAYPNNLELLHE